MDDDLPQFSPWPLLAWLLPLAALGYVALHYGSLPDRVPTHFDGRGQVNGWGPKATLWLLPGLGLGLQALLGFVTAHPQWCNVPVTITDANRAAVYALCRALVTFLRVVLGVLFAVLSYATVQGARGALPAWFVGVLFASLAATLGGSVYYSLKMRAA